MFDQAVRFQAQLHPDRPAVITRGGSYSYRRFDDHIQRLAARLRQQVDPGALVAVVVDNTYQHLAALNALAQLGAAWTSVISPGVEDRLERIRPDVVLARQGQQVPPGALLIERSWWDDPTPTARVQPRRALSPQDAAQVMFSSGTTGTPKRVVLTREMLDWRLHTFCMVRRLSPGARLLSLMALDTGGGSATPWMAWMWGGAVMTQLDTLMDPSRPETLRPNIVQASVNDLRVMLNSMPADAPPMPWMSLWTGGSALPSPLAKRVMQRITPNLYVIYGSTEAGAVACARADQIIAHEGAAGFVDPWAQVRIVGEDGRDVAPGEIGEVWVRTPRMATGYEGDPAQTRASFEDGWFKPGDIGRLRDDGLLCLSGRTGELVNVGGHKIGYVLIEETALACPGVVEAAAGHAETPDRLARPWVAVRADESFDAEALRDRLARRFGGLPVEVRTVSEIPRNAAGKVQRNLLARGVAEES